ncbi:MAG TPA: hypothetical protein VGZ02_07680 [Candidatus Baltobacteraceae bacterium]|nr:hypothetical protein [Candidatus Baltobacteraceae bacterium]
MRRFSLLIVTVLLCACGARSAVNQTIPSLMRTQAAPEAANPGQITYYSVGSGANDEEGSATYAAPDGNVYYGATSKVVSCCGHLGQFVPDSQSFTEIYVKGEPRSIFQSSDGAVWATVIPTNFGVVPATLVRVAPFNKSGLMAIQMPAPPNQSPYPYDVTQGSDKNIWFTVGNAAGAPAIGKLPLSGPYNTGEIVEYTVPNNPVLGGIDAGADGNLWFTDGANSLVYKMTTRGRMTAYSSAGQNPHGIRLGSDGLQYVSNFHQPYLTSVTTGGTFATIAVDQYSHPDVQSAAGGKVAFLDDWDTNPAIGLYDVGTGRIVEIPTLDVAAGKRTRPASVSIAPDGSVWFTCVLPPARGAPLCLGRLKLTSVWTVFPSTSITVYNYKSNHYPQLIGIGETGDSGPFTAKSSDSSIAAVSAVGPSNYGHDFSISGGTAGTTTVTISDPHGRSVAVNVTVK